MAHFETGLGQSFEDEEKENEIEDALVSADLAGVEAPKKGTKAYDRLMEAAQNYMREVKKIEASVSKISTSDSENYFSNVKSPSPSSDPIRREYHDQLTKMLLGKTRKTLPKEEADKVSNFAAYLTGDEEYIDTW
jgi:hypothetical protein